MRRSPKPVILFLAANPPGEQSSRRIVRDRDPVGDAQCHAPFAERYLQVGRMNGNEAGLYFAHQQTRPEPRDSPASPDAPAAPAERRAASLPRPRALASGSRCFTYSHSA